MNDKLVGIPTQGAILVLFSGNNCAPCEAIKPLLLEELVRRPGVGFLTLVPTTQSMPVYLKHGVRSSPTVVFFRDGNEIGRFSGLRDRARLEEALNRWNVN